MNLREWRKKADVSAEELAFRCGIAASTVYGYENGSRTPGPEVAQRIEAITKGAVSAASLVGLMPSLRSKRGVSEDTEKFEAGERISISVAVSAETADILGKAGIDIAEIGRKGAEQAIKEAQAQAWRAANADAIEASKRWVEKHGTLAEQLGLI